MVMCIIMMLLGQSTSPWEAFAELLAMGKTLEDFHVGSNYKQLKWHWSPIAYNGPALYKMIPHRT
ncbi:hypothetical protein NC652_024903 [Populus alba x Populus x berolinensis]|uniref:Uncharacterized protein n=1 Tax=Populus alba x Populus x berolinensis TaxID=444605 RepID=A0AAD6M939_9ROSI|nr:hypothetical protein NC652_024903 [Populus alba x Populus x berolinensis]KAJ6981223.1 hypothetical protein NC653_024582 [Populus alba x Populus x berolinensis]